MVNDVPLQSADESRPNAEIGYHWAPSHRRSAFCGVNIITVQQGGEAPGQGESAGLPLSELAAFLQVVCDTLSWRGAHVIVRATRDVPCGSEVLVDYLDPSLSPRERARVLWDQFAVAS